MAYGLSLHYFTPLGAFQVPMAKTYVVLRNWRKLVPHPNPVHLMFHFRPLKKICFRLLDQSCFEVPTLKCL